MDRVDTSGKTVQEAIQNALDQLGVSRNEVKVSVLKEGKHGIFGLGSEECMVRVELLESKIEMMDDATEKAKEITEALLAQLEVTASVEP